MKHPLLEVTPEIGAALAAGRPVVALESTIISHGMPYPQNVEMARNVEAVIRRGGAVPATIAMMNGKIKIGLTEADLLALARADDVVKVSRRDMADVIAKRKMGATTVAATMICAAMAGIKFFVTGGLGGVHRGYQDTLDASADLEELANSDVTVICAGAKAILDLPRTMEYLETKGVPVIGYGTDYLPAFYSKDSAIKLRHRADSAAEVAALVHSKDLLGLKGGLLVTVPVPDEHSMAHELIDGIIDEALAEANAAQIEGKDVTPFLLAKIVEKTDGASLKTNIELVYNNAKVGAAIACAYYE